MTATRRKLEGLLKKRPRNSHKGDFGHIFILAGSRGLTGAAALCSNAAMRSGAGLVTLGIPVSLNSIMSRKLTEVMTASLPETDKITLSLKAEKEILKKSKASNVVVLGPGLSQHPETQKLINKLIFKINKPMILDADALNAISKNPDALKKIKTEYVITPHRGEMARLISKSREYIKNNRLTVAKKFSRDYNAVVVLKGAGTIVAAPNRDYYINNTGNPGMATAGSGDVLAGIIAGFLGQGLKVFDASVLGVYVHGLAGDLAAKDKGEIGLISGDILENIPYAIKILTRADTRVAKGVRL
ncbi:MAG: NAD(P)H-hydrate dehydratase [Candidatus Omnitrophica bacterium]|nr:NAD(P)H-hydrate dehydratase [Candidatus Omnitrophota bacterium]